MAKRKADQIDERDALPRRSTRQKTTRTPPGGTTSAQHRNAAATKPVASTTTTTKQKSTAKNSRSDSSTKTADVPTSKSNPRSENHNNASSTSNDTSHNTNKHNDLPTSTRQYWLMKAEPESRLENGVDVKFSIDDLKARTKPEPWDGIRNYVARNNIRAMRMGDLAFFYHSSCKVPGIVGTMEVVEEHTPDLSAHDPKSPYYDAKSTEDKPKWSLVHVEFRSRFAEIIGLKELKELVGPGKPLDNMQMLKQSRLSVSKVSQAEWDYLNRLAGERAQATS